MERTLDTAYRLSRLGAWFGGTLIFLAAFLVGLDVTLRKLFNVTIGGADELSGYALAVGSAWAFGFALFERAHVRIDSLYGLFPIRLRMLLDLLGLITILVFFALVTRHAYVVMVQSALSNTHSLSRLGTPLVVPQAVWVVGLASFVLAGLLLLLKGGLAVVSGDVRTVVQLIGPRSAIEEIQEEIGQVEKSRTKKGTPQ